MRNVYSKDISSLPIFPYLEGICNALKSSPTRFLILTAETAAGKSTCVPLALLEHFKGKIIMLEGRRIAALAVASRVAELLGESVGETAGCVMRMERHTSERTRFTVMTEGVLTRMLQDDPLLEGADAVVLDEAHERSMNTDLALAMLKETGRARGDLHVIVMSATMDTSALSSYLGEGTPVMNVPGSLYPVETVYRPNTSVSAAVKEEAALLKCGEALLVFLPGIKEIRAVQSEIAGGVSGAEVMVLHSSVPFDEQKRVLSPPSPSSPPRIVLSSAIAETSLTVPCVKAVIDSGLSRVNRMNVASGMSSLVTETESTFSAEQRRGRAGRTGPGKCVRLWAESDKRLERVDPEILRGDIIPLVLECSAWSGGMCGVAKLQWLTPPSAGAWNAACETLVMLGLLQEAREASEKQYRITPLGKAALQLGVHPRIACVALVGCFAPPTSANADVAVAAQEGKTGCKSTSRTLEAAVSCAIEYSDYADAPPETQRRAKEDLLRRIKGLGKVGCFAPPASSSADGLLEGGTAAYGRLARKRAAKPPDSAVAAQVGKAGGFAADSQKDAPSKAMFLLAGFPDRLARLAEDGVHCAGNRVALYRFPSGRVASLRGELHCTSKAEEVRGVLPEWIIATDADAGEREGRVHKWLAVPNGEAEKWIAERAEVNTETHFISGTYRLKKVSSKCYGKIVLSKRDEAVTNEDYAAAVCNAVKENGIEWLPLGKAAKEFLLRAEFYEQHKGGKTKEGEGQKPLAFIDNLRYTADQWLSPFITGSTLTEAIVLDALRYGAVNGSADRLVPARITLQNGTQCKVLYEAAGGEVRPVIEAVIQRVFGCLSSPCIMGVPVTFKLLSPARRPLQVTNDLYGFWHGTWQEVAKEMRGRYPKHDWSYVPDE